MDWLPKSEPKVLIFNKRSLTSTGFINTQSLKPIQKPQNEKLELVHPEYSSKDLKEIFDYFNFVTETKDYCEEVIEKSKNRFEIFCTHPFFNKFWSRIQQEYNSNWKYSLVLIRKDRKIVKEMRNLLKNIVENPSEIFEFGNSNEGVKADWGKYLKNLQSLVKVAPKNHKKQLKSTFFKLKSRT